MKPALVLGIFLPLLVALAPARAEELPAPTLPFDCWMTVGDVYHQTYFIFCIRDRTGLPDRPPEAGAVNELVLDEIHRRVHEGTREELDSYVAANILLLERGDLWRIRTISYPTESSWQEERPQTLVRMLCPNGYDCPVHFRRW